jgi:drug/metabolite transporter (DMT)-like permease
MKGSYKKTNGYGIGLMLLAMLLFTINDAIGKWLVVTYPVGQLIAIRSFAALIILLPLATINGGKDKIFKVKNLKLHLLRAILAIAEVSCFYWSLRYLPLADVFMFYLASPLFLTAFSIILLKEKVGLLRWCGIVVGFGGVTLIFPPTETTISFPALIAFGGSLSLALMLTLTRVLKATGDLTLIIFQTIAVGIGGTLTIPMTWIMPSFNDLMLFSFLGFIATTGHYLMNKSVIVSNPSVVAPFQYTSIIWALILGYLIWGDTSSTSALIGSTIIILSGLFVIYEESKIKNT